MESPLRILLISYYWPPSGGAGVQRWLKMVKYLARDGHRVTVYTPLNPDFPTRDESLLREVEPSVEVLRRRILEPYAWFRQGRRAGAGLMHEGASKKRRGLLGRFVLWVRANLFVPDARMLWVKPSVRFLSAWLRAHPQDAIITTGPPHSMHLIGLGLSRRLGVRWIADFRDPWVNIDYMHHLPLTSWARGRHREQERLVVRGASEVVVVTPGMRREYEPLRGGRVHVVMNGYDEEDFGGCAPYAGGSGRFHLVYAGSLNADRNPHTLWEALGLLARRGDLQPGDMVVRIVGGVDGQVRDSVESLGLRDYVEYSAPVPHSHVPRMLCEASALLLCVNDTPNSRGILTGKLFEYLASGRPIVCTGPKDGDAAGLLVGSGAGCAFGRGDAEAMAEHLLELMGKDRRGGLSSRVNGVGGFSRREQAAEIARIARNGSE